MKPKPTVLIVSMALAAFCLPNGSGQGGNDTPVKTEIFIAGLQVYRVQRKNSSPEKSTTTTREREPSRKGPIARLHRGEVIRVMTAARLAQPELASCLPSEATSVVQLVVEKRGTQMNFFPKGRSSGNTVGGAVQREWLDAHSSACSLYSAVYPAWLRAGFMWAPSGFDAKPTVRQIKATPDRPDGLYSAKQWEFSIESTYSFHVIPNPFASLVNLEISTPNPVHYKLASQLLAARFRLTRPMGPWLFRGSLQASATIVGSAIISGPESYFAGLAIGLRYDFVQPGARVVPFFELRGGPGVTDSAGGPHHQQQDLTFTYLLSAGLRYDYNRRWSVTLSALDQHLSNAYLAKENYGFDSLGISLGLFAHF